MKKFLLVLGIIGLAVTARCNSILYSDLGPGGTYDQINAYPFFKATLSSLDLAAQFTPSASGNIGRVDVGLTYDIQGPVNVYLFGDASGSPDNANQTLLGSGTPSAAYGTTNNSFVSFSVPGSIPVTIGTNYWLVVKCTTAITEESWHWSSPQVVGPAAFSADNFPWVVGTTQILPAFRLSTAAVSAPDSGNTLLLLLGSIVALFGAKRRSEIGDRRSKVEG